MALVGFAPVREKCFAEGCCVCAHAGKKERGRLRRAFTSRRADALVCRLDGGVGMAPAHAAVRQKTSPAPAQRSCVRLVSSGALASPFRLLPHVREWHPPPFSRPNCGWSAFYAEKKSGRQGVGVSPSQEKSLVVPRASDLFFSPSCDPHVSNGVTFSRGKMGLRCRRLLCPVCPPSSADNGTATIRRQPTIGCFF
nr:hypothetical protein [Pandoravirus massiliensis]